jgi:Bacteriophage tail sheath protein
MPITPTYPGVYIEELPSNSHAITAAPTSIAVFVGYTHPFMTDPANWNQATQIFSFTDYENGFGGLYSSGVFESHVAYAVSQFFLNGGAVAYVVALQPNYYDANTGTNHGPAQNPTVQVGAVQFTGLQPVDLVPMTVTINNVQTVTNANDTADVSISYGAMSETYRKVNLGATTDPNFIMTRMNNVSKLVTVQASANSSFTAVGQAALQTPASVDPTWTTFSVDDFTGVFQQDSSLDKLSIFNLLLIPGVADTTIWSEALAFCERKLAFVIMDPPIQDTADGFGQNLPMIYNDFQGSIIPKSTNGALYFPYLNCGDPLSGNTFPLPPSGSVAGLYATTDNDRGVWKAPAGLQAVVQNTIGVVDTGNMTDARQGTLNQIGVDCLRNFPGIGTVIWGARTLVTENTSQQQWEYVSVRRMALFLEQTLRANLTWVVFEPNDATLWVAIRGSIESFMLSLFQQGAFQGTKPSEAFQVLCDSTTTTQQDIDNGVVNILVAFAPLKPAEFVVIQIAQLAGQSQS